MRNFIRRVPGFRTGTRWKQIAAGTTYGVVALGLIGALRSPSTPRPTPTSSPVVATATRPPQPTAAQPTTVPPTATRPPAPTNTTSRAQSAESAPCFVGQVKGNRNSLIFHVPGGASYAQTRENVVCFDTPAQATAAGYRQAAN